MFLTDAYFQGDLYLPALASTKPSLVGIGRMLSTVAENDLAYYVDKYEREFLRLLLGSDLYDAFVAGLEEPNHGKWIKLKDAIYDSTGPYPYSPAANYVYYMLIGHNVTATTMKGEIVPQQDYAKSASAKQKRVNAWNEIAPATKRIWKFIEDNRADYGRYSLDDVCCFNRFEPLNIFGI